MNPPPLPPDASTALTNERLRPLPLSCHNHGALMVKVVAPLLILLSAINSVWGGEDTSGWKHPDPITYESLKAWHKSGGLEAYIWPKEHHLDLNGDGRDEVFLGVSGFGRGMFYSLFTKTKAGWLMLSEEIVGSHQPFSVLPAKHGKWHDFVALAPSGRGGLFEMVYTWDGTHYGQKSFREISHEELFGDEKK